MDTRYPEDGPDDLEAVDPFDEGSSPLGLEVDSGAHPRPSRLRAPVALAIALAIAVGLGLYLYASDDNSDRWEIRCTRGSAEARRGLYFPWGTRRIADDAHDSLELPAGVSCASVRLGSLQELDRTLGALLLEAAEHRLGQGGPEALAQARLDVERARRLQGLEDDQRQRAEALLADMSYHEAREILRQVERSLWKARRQLERARTLGAGDRMGDLGEWLRFVEIETERFQPALGPGRHGEDTAPTEESPPPQPAKRPEPPPRDDEVFL